MVICGLRHGGNAHYWLLPGSGRRLAGERPIASPMESRVSEPITLLERGFALAAGRLAAAGDISWSTPSVCVEWTLRQLVNHLIGIPTVLGRAASGERLEPDEFSPDVMAETDYFGLDASSAYDAAVSKALEVCARPDALDGVCAMPRGDVPFRNLVTLVVSDTVVHAWDLARSTGQDAEIPDDLAELGYTFMKGFVSPNARGGTFKHFDQPVEVGPDASPTDRLVAFLGRDPAAR